MYIKFWTLKVKCTEYEICGQATFNQDNNNGFFEVERDMPQFSVGFRI